MMPRVAVRMWAWAAVLRILKRNVALETLVRLMQRPPKHSRAAADLERTIESYMNMTGRFPFRPPANCLERSLAAYRMLCEAAADPELVIGVRRAGEHGVDGHVWVTVAGRPLAEPPDSLAEFIPMVRFDSAGRRHSPAGFDIPASGMSFD